MKQRGNIRRKIFLKTLPEFQFALVLCSQPLIWIHLLFGSDVPVEKMLSIASRQAGEAVAGGQHWAVVKALHSEWVPGLGLWPGSRMTWHMSLKSSGILCLTLLNDCGTLRHFLRLGDISGYRLAQVWDLEDISRNIWQRGTSIFLN